MRFPVLLKFHASRQQEQALQAYARERYEGITVQHRASPQEVVL